MDTIATLYSSGSFAELYSGRTDEELRTLAGQMSSLTPEAGAALQDELRRRSLQSIERSAVGEATVHGPGARFHAERILSFSRFPRSSWSWIHLVLIGICLPLLVQYFLFNLWPVLRAIPFFYRSNMLAIPFFPVQSLIGLAVGVAAARSRNVFWENKVAERVWVLPAVWMLFLLMSYKPQSLIDEDRWRHFFWPDLHGVPLFQKLTSLPLLVSASYAVGHLAGRKLFPQKTQ